jgi:hypothetical protein
MIAFAIARAKRILLISFPLPVNRGTLQRLGTERAAVTGREGAMDMIVDFSASPPVAIPSRLTHEHVTKPSPAPGFRRVYVAHATNCSARCACTPSRTTTRTFMWSAAWTSPSPSSA